MTRPEVHPQEHVQRPSPFGRLRPGYDHPAQQPLRFHFLEARDSSRGLWQAASSDSSQPRDSKNQPAKQPQTKQPAQKAQNPAPPAKLININTASYDKLKEINGIGDALAGRILEYRKKHGPFSAIEDIKNVSGIGESIFQRIKDQITID